jgi:hypothetical protein
MNSAARKLAQRQHKLTTAAAIAVVVLLAITAALVIWGVWQAAIHIPTAWWLPVEQRPFGGRL